MPNGITPSKNRKGMDPSTKDRLENAPSIVKADVNGVFGDRVFEPGSGLAFDRMSNENGLVGANNSWIVLGRDRPSNEASGYGALGDYNCASIDLVVGRMGANPQVGVWVSPNFFTDAARIHISQKTNIDENFNLTPGKVGDARERSGIGIKADGVRIIAREGIKLVTGTDAKNAQDGDADLLTGIDIIAMNDETTLQPMVLGNNLKLALGEMCSIIDSTCGIIMSLTNLLNDYVQKMGSHDHFGVKFWGTNTAQSTDSISATAKATTKLMDECLVGVTEPKKQYLAILSDIS